MPRGQGQVHKGQRKSHEAQQRKELLSRAKLGQDSAGPQGRCIGSHVSNSAPEIHGRKSGGSIRAGQSLQMPRKLLVPAVLALGHAHMWEEATIA